MSGATADGEVHAVYAYSKGFHHNTYQLSATLPHACDRVEWFRPQSSGPASFANWTRAPRPAGRAAAAAPARKQRRRALEQQLARNAREGAALDAAESTLRQRRVALEAEQAALGAALLAEGAAGSESPQFM